MLTSRSLNSWQISPADGWVALCRIFKTAYRWVWFAGAIGLFAYLTSDGIQPAETEDWVFLALLCSRILPDLIWQIIAALFCFGITVVIEIFRGFFGKLPRELDKQERYKSWPDLGTTLIVLMTAIVRFLIPVLIGLIIGVVWNLISHKFVATKLLNVHALYLVFGALVVAGAYGLWEVISNAFEQRTVGLSERQLAEFAKHI